MWSALRHAREAACGFARRHRRVLVAATVGAACVGGAVYAYRRVVSETERFSRQLQRQLAEHQRLQLALRSTTDESAAAVRRFLPKLRARLHALVDLERVVQELKAVRKADRSRRNALWEEAKRLAFTRYLTGLVAFALWHLLVFAQLAVIGKRVFERNAGDAGDAVAGAGTQEEEDKAHHAFLASGLEYFLEEALGQIKTHVERAVANNALLQSWDVTKKTSVSRDELNALLQALFADVMPSISADGAAADAERDERELRTWRAFLIYPDKRRGQSEQVISLLNDLWDLLESDLFAPALQHSLGFLCGNAFQDLNDVVYGGSRGAEAGGEAAPVSHPPPPLAKLIPCLQTEVGKLLQASGPDSYVAKYSQGVGEMEAFRNFYEAIFFQPDESVGMQFI